MSKSSDTPRSLLHRIGVAGPACSHAFQGSGAPKILVAIATTLTALLLTVAPAFAKEVHAYSSSFGSEGSGAGQLQEPDGVAVNNVTGDVYVLDRGNNRIDEFESNGAFMQAWGWGVADGLSMFEACGPDAFPPTATCKEGISGSGAGQFDSAEGIAVDNSGSASDPSKEDVYVTDASNGAIDKFSPTGAYINQIDGVPGKSFDGGSKRCDRYNTEPPYKGIEIAEENTLCGAAVGSTGELSVDWRGIAGSSSAEFFSFSNALENKYVAKLGFERPLYNSALAVDSAEDFYATIGGATELLQKRSSTGAVLIEAFGEGSTSGVAVDLSDNDVFIDHDNEPSKPGSVQEFSSENAALETFGAGHLKGGAGLAVNSSTGTASSGALYVANSGSDDVAVFPIITVPSVAVEPVSSSTASSVTFRGTVNPEGTPIIGCEFEYSTKEAYSEVQTLTYAGITGGTYSLALGGQATAAEGTGDPVGPATGSGELTEASNTLTGVSTTGGAFVAGAQIEGAGIPAGTKIVSVHAGTLVLSAAATVSGSVALRAVSDQVGAVSTTAGTFAAGEQIEGAGIPAGSTIVAVGAGTLTLSADVTASGTGVALSSALAYDASAAQVQSVLEGLSSVGAGAVAVSGSQGGPYTVAFQGSLADTKVSELTADSGALTPAGASVTVAVTSEGGHRSGTVACSSPHTVSPSEPLTGTAPLALSATATGLTQGAKYDYRLSVLAAGETYNSTELSYFLPRTATIAGESARFVEPTQASLEAEINPGGTETPYHFEYGPAAGSYDVSVPVPDASTSASLTGVRVGVLAKNLIPGTTYHFRVVASPLSGDVDGPDETFTTPVLPSAPPETCPNAELRSEQPFGLGLPDCRAYEMVSPLDKDDSNILFTDSRASVSGETLAYLSAGSFAGSGPEPQGSGAVNRYVSRREPDGWATENVTPRAQPRNVVFAEPFQELLFTPSLSEGVLEEVNAPLVAGEPAGYTNVYLADLASTPVSYQTVSNVIPPGIVPYQENRGEGEPEGAGASTDLSHVVFQAGENLTEGALGKIPDHVYEWVDGKLSQVDITPAGKSFESWDNVGAPHGYLPREKDAWHAVSANGLRVFFTAGGAGEVEENGQLYVRENPEQPQSEIGGHGECVVPADACTVEVSASQRTNVNGEPEPDPNGSRPAYYRDASVDGSRVFFISRAELTNDANTGPKDNAANLYEYDLETGILTDITDVTEAEEAEDPDGAAVLNVVTAGEDGSYVYFVADGVLASNENANKEKAQPGNCRKKWQGEEPTGEPTCSLYVSHDNAGTWETKFIATLAGNKENDHDPQEEAAGNGDETDWGGIEGSLYNSYEFGPGQHSARVTPDGTTLAFRSERPLTGYDNERAEPGECESNEQTGRCMEVYLYDAITERLVCASCDPSGARPVGPAQLGGDEKGGESLAQPSSFYLPRNLSEDGRRLFFQSPDPLVAHDSNGKLNVYEWEAVGEGSCTQAAGCVLPISDVAGDYESRFMDADPTGENVFIATADQLLPSDTDDRVDVYDARVGGGFPISTPPPVCTNGDSCKPPASPQPAIFGAPSSATFSGPGNPVPAGSPPTETTKKAVRCKRGKRLSHGKCVKVKSKKKRAKKSTHRKGGK